MTKTIYFVTGNAGKFTEAQKYISEHEPSIHLEHVAIDLREEQTLDQKAIALEKAEDAFAQVQKPLIVEDAAHYFTHFNKFPGTMTKFVFDALGYEGLLKLVEDDNRAYRLLYLVYIDKPGEPHVFEGRCDGVIVRPEKFESHPQLPYNAIFKPNGSDKTFDELRNTPDAQKFSYRAQALEKFLAWYKTR